jgi:DNA-binding transcriptional regulator LsrR (DeoR family)
MPPNKEADKLDQAARIAWLYYVAGKTQQQIAAALHISRQTAQRLLGLAVERNLVNVRLSHRISSCAALEEALRSHYQLRLCEVVPFDADELDSLQAKIAVTGARVMEHFLSSEQSIIGALGTGQTLKSVISRLPVLRRPQHRFVNLVGTFARDGSSNLYDVAFSMAEKTGSRYYLLPAPLLVSSVEERLSWCDHDLYKTVARIAAKADVTFIGIGHIAPGCPLERDGYISRQEVRRLQQAGAIGETSGWAWDSSGELIDLPTYHDKLTGILPPRHSKNPVIAFAGGKYKWEAVRAALRGRWINGLVTDESCAIAIAESEGLTPRSSGEIEAVKGEK